MAKGDAATGSNASAMQTQNAPLNASLGSGGMVSGPSRLGTGFGGGQTSDPGAVGIGPSPAVANGIVGNPSGYQPNYQPNNMVGGPAQPMGGRIGYGMGLPRAPQMGQNNTAVGAQPTSVVGPTDPNEIIRRIMMMNRPMGQTSAMSQPQQQ